MKNMPAPKSLAILHFAYPPNLGGVEILLREQAFLLDELGYEVHVFTGSGSSDNPRITVHEVPEFQSILNFHPDLQEKVFAGQFDASFDDLVRKEKELLHTHLVPFDTIIVHNMLTVSRNLAFTQAFYDYAAETDKTIVVYTHDHMYIRENQQIDWSRVSSAKEKELLTQVLPHAQYVAISHELKQALTQIMPLSDTNITVVPNGLNIERFLEFDPTISQIVNTHQLLNRFPIILSPVNLLRRKNLEYAVDIIAELKKTFPEIRYLISGKPSKHRKTDDYEAEIMKRIKDRGLEDNVIFLSRLVDRSFEDTELHDLYTLADAVFYFSRQENFGLPIIEAPLTKTPIFVSDLAVFHEIAGNLLPYINTVSIDPAEAARRVQVVLEENNAQLRYQVRSKYNLKTILQEKLIPLL